MHTTLFDQFPPEIVCRHAIRLPVDADRAWALVGNFGEARIGAEFIDRIDVKGSGVGAVRTLHVKGGITLRERLEEYSDEDRHYVWITTTTAVDGRHGEMRRRLDANILMLFSAVRR